jgi:alkylation response protein AidB-like acyl-CoA dehydrogenase
MTSLADDDVGGEAVALALEHVLARELDRESLLDAAHRDEPLADLHGHLVELGLPAIALAGEGSGLDLSFRAIAEVFAVVGRRLVPVTERDEALLLAPLLAAAVREGDPAGSEWLARLLDGNLRGGARVAVDDPRLAREEAADEWLVRFDRLPVWLAPGAEVAVVATSMWTALLDLGAPGLELTPTIALDAGQGAVILSGAQSVPRARVTGGGAARRHVLRWHIGVAAELTGIAHQMLATSAEYALSRHQFGKPIASYQAISHRLADMYVALDSCRALLARLVMLTEDGQVTSPLLTVVRHGIPQAARFVCEGAIQVHGGLGFTWEQGLHLWYRRVLQTQAAFGGPSATACATGRAYLDALAADDGVVGSSSTRELTRLGGGPYARTEDD